MLIPHDRGSTQTLNLSAYQLWLVVVLLVGLSFGSAFFFSRQRTLGAEMKRLRQAKRDLEFRCASQAPAAAPNTADARERAEIEAGLRAEYEASIAAITAELGEVRDMEAQARRLTGLPPREVNKHAQSLSLDGGKGGGSTDLGDIAYERGDVIISPPDVIYGLSQPSADLIIQEMNLRTDSLRLLVADLETQADEVSRLPSIVPTASRRWRITSPFGYRKDPFTLRVRHHAGTDIAAAYGSPVIATARGKVVFAAYDGALGRTVRIDHGNGIETVYAHLKKATVAVGDVVERRATIGALGSSGRTTGPHLHYEVRVNGKPVNAQKYFRE